MNSHSEEELEKIKMERLIDEYCARMVSIMLCAGGFTVGLIIGYILSKWWNL